jgi:hypothetical protein
MLLRNERPAQTAEVPEIRLQAVVVHVERAVDVLHHRLRLQEGERDAAGGQRRGGPGVGCVVARLEGEAHVVLNGALALGVERDAHGDLRSEATLGRGYQMLSTVVRRWLALISVLRDMLDGK